ncbi:MAG: DUF2807 domain-containing protein [Ignavibacteria bacterium]|jgi:hypothetical protein|nr:DUF2807 domain-containing protein [Ignavibacteria bacterium]MCU7504388.1 DUF2807 domain-containing protein [Ignavibacteria bacterium]MCU7517611.1 DUF2807 domain-containing protein [Ignavibacteria bacterium]
MKRNLFRSLALLVPVLFLACSLLCAQEIRKFDFKNFNRVEASSGMHVQITQSGNYSVEVKASDRDLKQLLVEQHGNKLEFKLKGWFHHLNDEIYIKITMPKLNYISLSGGSMGNISMDNSSENFEADLSGGAKLKGNLKCADASFELSGGSWMNVSGSGKNLKVDGSGGSQFKLKDFAVGNVNSELSGGSYAEVRMNGKLNADQSGGSRTVYYGNASMGRSDLSGGSSVSKGE